MAAFCVLLRVGKAARDDPLERLQVVVDVDGEAVGRHAALDAHPDCGQLAPALDPHPDEPVLRMRLDPEGCRGLDDGGLEGADVAPQVERVP